MNQDSEYHSDKTANSGDRPVKSHRKWREIVMAVSLLLVSGTGLGLIYGWYLIQRKLIPLIETEAGNYLHRPLELGELRSISFTGASFGESALPSTSENPDFVKTKGVKVNFAPLHFLRQKELKLDLTLVKPDVYIEQAESKLWTPTDFGSDKESKGKIKVEVKSIQLDEGQLSLVAYNSQTNSLNPAVIANIDEITIRPQDDAIKFDAAAELIQGGKFTVNGKGYSKTGIIDLDLIARQLKASEVSNLLALPIELERGNLDGKLGVTLTEDEPIPQLQGALDLDNVSLQIPGLVKPFSGSQGKLRFEGSKINFNRLATNFGEVSGLASGSLNLAEAGNYQINTQVKPVAAQKVIEALELDAPVPIKGKIGGNVAVRGSLEAPVVQFELATTSPSSIDQVDFQEINADLELIGTTLNVRQFTSSPKGGGTIVGNGKFQLDGLQNLAFNVQAAGVSAKAIASGYQNQLPVDIGQISGQTNISAQATDLSTLRFRNGKANFDLGNGIVEVDNLDYGKGVWSSKLTASGVEFGSLPIGKGSAPTIAQGLVTGVFDVSGTKDFGNLNQVKAKGQANLNTVGGKVAIPKIVINQGNWTADTTTKNLKLQRLFPDLPDEFNDNLSGKFYLTGNIPDQAQPQTLINGFGDLTLAQGQVKVDDLKIVDQDWTAIAQGTNLKLKQLSSSTPDQFAGLINGSLKLAGTIDNITPEGIKATGNGSLTLPEGIFQAQNLAIANGRFNAQLTPQQVDLSLFADPNSDELELKGKLGGQLAVAGKVDNLSPTAVTAKGNLSFSQGIDLLENPLSATLAWDGKRLNVLQAKGNSLNAQGYVVLDKSFFSDIPDQLAAVDYFEFDVREARSLNLKKLRLPLPNWAKNLDYAGRGDFSGKIRGVPSAMNINGNLSLNNLRVEELNFAPLLRGNVQVSPATGVKLNLQEVLTRPLLSATSNVDNQSRSLDQIKLVLDPNFSPLMLALVQDDFRVMGTGRQKILNLTTANVPIELLKTIALKSGELKIPKNIALQPVKGSMSGDFSFNLETLATTGNNLVIEKPALASIRGDRLAGNFQYADGYFAIQDVEFQQRDSIYKLKGNLNQKPDDLELDGEISVNGGQIQDILVAMQIFELTDFARIFSDRAYGKAADLYQPASSSGKPLFDLGLKDAPVIDQLQLLAAIQAWLASVQEERQTALVPDLKNLRGTFDGKIDMFGSLKKGITSEFDFIGQEWHWGNLTGEKIIAKGNLREGILTLLPISVQLRDLSKANSVQKIHNNNILPTLLFTGTFGGATQSGQFRLVDVPMKLIEQLFSLPPEPAVDGLINATASIAGSKDNPQARGEISIDDASLNETSIQSTKGSFNYKQSRLEFSASSIIAENADPLTLRGSVPYQLPFAKAEPKSDRLELQLNVKDKGLALLDIFSRGELKWIDGAGQIALDITGILDQEQNLPRKLSAQGTANIKNATIAAKSLPKNLLTKINSQVFFDLDNVRVNNFEGDFGGGKITAAGTIPFGDTAPLNPLSINFNDIQKVTIPKLYNGGVRGNLQILGKATEPSIAGDLTLFDGTIVLNDDSESNNDQAKPTNLSDRVNAIAQRNAAEQGIAAVTQYKNLKLRLGKDIQISQQPIFTFTATGNLDINGTFLQPSPNGTIRLKRGQVNLFTTQLNLSRDYQNTARFSSNNVLDPFLDVLLVGSAIEASNRSVPSELSPTEIPDSGLTTLETIRVSAKVKGLASQITNKIELTSSPPRSPAEIAVLLGGGFVEALTNSNGTSGLATLAGSALFGSLNGEFNNIFPIGELRLFPTPIIDENRDNQGDGLAGEIAFDLIKNLSFSVLKILNNDTPAQFGFRYRFNDNFVLRGSSNFQEDGTRGLIEYELRF
ncbi:translocation/assembly module TamB domain-containing protein [Pleurocapsa sp. CCALA 161]|uniref:translocation/assembly module TamB domain-containing protein n=1 Tax=Pleurocapsa sp. CCALA 161 TaxID=2107688 RepID=UPI001E65B21B|nr:translocation/assembly module TamB domain-containing protein [Pleurocapsa sp. CCALA 161]